MKVIKPLLLGFLWRTYKRQGDHLALTALLAFPFSDPDVPLTEQEMWKSVVPLIPKDTAWDEGVPKDRGEVLLLGDCRSPGGTPASHRRVSLRVGPVAKALDVYGNRFWTRDRGILRKTDPEPFLSMPVDFFHAFGGPGYGPNPAGKGCDDPSDGSLRPLPNIEDPLRPLSSPDDRPEPAGFGPLGLTWTGRFSKVGKYRSLELGKEPPPLPSDTEWTLFNQALPDQWLPGMWSGGEEISLTGFHPEDDTQVSRLPRMMIRAFVHFRDESAIEADMHPETVWLFPGPSMGVVVHRGSIPLRSDDASEVATILLGAEDPGENRPAEHYLAAKTRREEKESQDLSRFGDAPLLPARLADDPRANLLDPAVLMKQTSPTPFKFPKLVTKQLDLAQKRFDKVRESLSSLPPSPPESPESSGKSLQEQMDAAGKKLKELQEKFQTPRPPATPEKLEELKKTSIDVEALKRQAAEKFQAAIDRIPPDALEKLGKTREELLSKVPLIAGAVGGQEARRTQAPSKIQPSIETLIGKDRILDSLKSARNRIASSFPEGSAPPPQFSERLAEMDARIESVAERLEKMSSSIPQPSVEGLIRILHHYAPPAPDPARSSELRRMAMEELARRGSFRNRNLRGADLSGLNLSGADFSDADLIGADFSGADLTGTQFAGAWAAHADFSRCTLDRTNFAGASLGCANLSGSRGTATSFDKAFLSGATLESATLADGDFSGADLFHTVFRRAVIHRGRFPQAKLLRAGALPHPRFDGLPPTESAISRYPVEDIDFTGSNFTKALFIKVDFVRANFSKCCLDQANFVECTGPGTRFEEASLKKVAFPKSAGFKHSSFRKADLSGANLRDLDLEGSDFRGAVLIGMDGSGGVFRSARLSGVRASRVVFQKSDLRRADGRGGDFSQALFLKADLRGADFSHGSLYKAGFTGARIDPETLWDRALTGKTNISRERS